MVLRNVAELVITPKGHGRTTEQGLTLEQATAVLDKAKTSRLNAYVVLSLMTGIRTEEARELRWDHVVAWVDDETGWRPVTEVGFEQGVAPNLNYVSQGFCWPVMGVFA